MIVFRIVQERFAADLSGEGARLYGGRWNSKGNPMLYCAESIALAMAEALVHLPNPVPPLNHQLVTIDIPDDSIKELKILSKMFQSGFYSVANTRKLGDDFLVTGSSLAMKVPSIIVPLSYNYLINPRHSLSKSIRIIHREPFHFDNRLREGSSE